MPFTEDDKTWLREELTSQRHWIEEQFTGQRASFQEQIATQRNWIEEQLAIQRNWLQQQITILDAKIERVETRLLTEFHKWASPIDARLRSHTATLRALDVEQEALTDRLKKLEDGSAHG